MEKKEALEYLKKEGQEDVYFCPICNREADKQHLVDSFDKHPSLVELVYDLKQRGVKSLIEIVD